MTRRPSLFRSAFLPLALLVAVACGSGLGTPPPTRSPGGPSGSVPGSSGEPPSVRPPSTGATGIRELADFPDSGAFEITGATVTAEGFVAVGFGAMDEDADYFGPRAGIVWHSGDGERWSASREPELEGVTPLRVAALGADLYMLGSAEAPEAGFAVWRSAAGGPWQRLPPPPEMLDAIAVDDLVTGGDRLFAYGSLSDARETPVLWSSTDGLAWSRTTELSGIDPLTAFAATPTGYVAFGTVLRPESESTDLTAAFSTDGARYAAAVTPSLPDAGIDDLAVGTGGVVGVGRAYADEIDLRALALFSTDGSSWIEGSADNGSFTDAALAAAHATDSGYVALGYELDASDFAVHDGRVWVSADGQSWRSLYAIDGVSLITASASGSPGVVVFSADQTEDDEGVTSTVAAWFAPGSALVP